MQNRNNKQKWWFKALVIGATIPIFAVLIHYLIPEPVIPDHSHPVVGDVLVNNPAGEKIVFRKVPQIKKDGATVIDVYLDPGGAVPISHVHPNTDEIFTVLQGNVHFLVDGKIELAKAGKSILVPAGRPHGLTNPFTEPAQIQVKMAPTGGLNMALTQVHGFMNNNKEISAASEFLQMLRFAERYEVYRGDLPIWFQRIGITFLAPVARALGFRSFYESYSLEARARNLSKQEAQ